MGRIISFHSSRHRAIVFVKMDADKNAIAHAIGECRPLCQRHISVAQACHHVRDPFRLQQAKAARAQLPVPGSLSSILPSFPLVESCSSRCLVTAVRSGSSLASPVCRAICPMLHASSADFSAASKLVSGAYSALRNDSISSLDCRVPLSAAKPCRVCAKLVPLVAISPSYPPRRNTPSSALPPTSAKPTP